LVPLGCPVIHFPPGFLGSDGDVVERDGSKFHSLCSGKMCRISFIIGQFCNRNVEK
jgi:hypothetical protein